MKDKIMERWSTYETYHVPLGDKKVADIIVTNHAKSRWEDRIESQKTGYDDIGYDDICSFLWERLRTDQIQPYYRNEEDVYVVDEDLIFVAEFSLMTNAFDITGEPLHKMIIITFLGRMSETIELRDLKSYYSWLRHSRRMTLIKNSRKKR